MSTLNGDSQKVVDLLCQKIDDGNKQINTRFDDFQKGFASYREDNKKHINTKHDDQQKMINNHCLRIRGLEKYKNQIGGILIAVTIIISAVWTIATQLLTKN